VRLVPPTHPPHTPIHHQANAIVNHPKLADHIAFYYHAALFSPPLNTWITAIAIWIHGLNQLLPRSPNTAQQRLLRPLTATSRNNRQETAVLAGKFGFGLIPTFS